MRSQANSSRGHLLRNPLTVIATALACFLAVLALLSARVMSGREPALTASASGSAATTRGGHTILRTSASGRILGPATGGTGVRANGAQPATLVTRTSGFAGEDAHDD